MIQPLTQYLQSKVHLRAKVMDVTPRQTGCAGQAADAISAYIQVKMEDAPSLLKIPKSECPDIWIRPPNSKWPKSWSSMEDPVVPLEGQFEKDLLEHGWEQVPNWECIFVHRENGLFLSVYVDEVKLVGKKQNIDPMWNVLVKEVDLGEPTSFFDLFFFWLHSTRMSNKQRYCGQV